MACDHKRTSAKYCLPPIQAENTERWEDWTNELDAAIAVGGLLWGAAQMDIPEGMLGAPARPGWRRLQ